MTELEPGASAERSIGEKCKLQVRRVKYEGRSVVAMAMIRYMADRATGAGDLGGGE